MPATRVTSFNPWHLVFVLDDSGSMQGRRAEHVNRAMEDLMDELGLLSMGMKPYFRISIIVFGSKVEVQCEAATESDFTAQQMVRLSGKRGTTNAASALDEARRLLQRNPGKASDFTPFVWFMTDGAPDDKDLALKAAQQLRELEIPAGAPKIFTVGFGTTDEEFMRSVASSSEFYIELTDPRQLTTLFPTIGTVVTQPPRDAEDGADEMARRMAASAQPRVIEL